MKDNIDYNKIKKISSTYIQRNFKKALKEIETEQLMIVTKNGKPDLVIMTLEYYNKLESSKK